MLIADKPIGDGIIIDGDRYVLILGMHKNLVRLGVGSRKNEAEGYGHSEQFWAKSLTIDARKQLHCDIEKSECTFHLRPHF